MPMGAIGQWETYYPGPAFKWEWRNQFKQKLLESNQKETLISPSCFLHLTASIAN